MEISILILISFLLILAYIFDISSAFTRVPSVILLLLLGWGVRQAAVNLAITVPDLAFLLPILGTIGLILIVLEGALELEINRSKISIINKAFLLALVPMVIVALIIATVINYYELADFKTSLLNAIPFCVISSAVAIPSVRSLHKRTKELVVYESSFSDIIGVLFFNFIALNQVIDSETFLGFGYQLLMIVGVSFISILLLSFLLSRNSHHVTYAPIILLVILIYALSKQFHLPGLIFILVFGLFLGNLEELRHFKWFEVFKPAKFEKEVEKFKDITAEVTFLVRALFFILFGYLMETEELLNLETLPWATGIVSLIILIRWFILKVFYLPVKDLLFIAPRGLITILLFLSIVPDQGIPFINKSIVIQTIVLSVIIMMTGLMFIQKPGKKPLNQQYMEEVFTGEE
jgi:hypothetical protein